MNPPARPGWENGHVVCNICGDSIPESQAARDMEGYHCLADCSHKVFLTPNGHGIRKEVMAFSKKDGEVCCCPHCGREGIKNAPEEQEFVRQRSDGEWECWACKYPNREWMKNRFTDLGDTPL